MNRRPSRPACISFITHSASSRSIVGHARFMERTAYLHAAASPMAFPKIFGIVRIYRVLRETCIVVGRLLMFEGRQRLDSAGSRFQPLLSFPFRLSMGCGAASAFHNPVLDLRLSHIALQSDLVIRPVACVSPGATILVVGPEIQYLNSVFKGDHIPGPHPPEPSAAA